ncbi:MAG: MBL fold metallo-hydrolase [Candidatus Lokiarchaeota archaeon]|nr:MBL fold metallo-hydrolase [Candidatus Lokiarchaeota archaeon]
MEGDQPACKVTVACNNDVNPLIEAGDTRFLEFPRSLMRNLVGEHGFSCHVKVGSKSIVFDTGGVKKTFLNNIQAVEPDYETISSIVLSHGHHDHVGGLVTFLALLKDKIGELPAITCHPAALAKRYSYDPKGGIQLPLDPNDVLPLVRRGTLKEHAGANEATLERLGARVEASPEPVVLHEDGALGISIKATGEIPRIHETEFFPKNYLIEQDGRFVKDMFPDDQALVVERRGAFSALFLGCCHAGIENTVACARTLVKAPIRIIAGGFHMTGAGTGAIERKHAFLEALAKEGEGSPGPERLVLRPTHCSGERFYLHLKTKGSDSLDVDRLPAGTRFLI